MKNNLSEQKFLQNRILKDVIRVTLVAIAYFAVARFSLKLIFEPEGIAAIWPASGIFLSAVLLCRKGLRPYLIGTLFITDFIAEMYSGSSFQVSSIYSLALTFDASFSVWLLNRFSKQPFSIYRTRDVFGFILLSVVFSNALAASIASFAPYFFLDTPFWKSWILWWSADAVGNLLITPLILSWASYSWKMASPYNLKWVSDTAIFFGAIILIIYLVIKIPPSDFEFFFAINFLTFPFLIWTAFRMGMRHATAAIVLISSTIIFIAISGELSVFENQGHIQLVNVLFVQLFLALISISTLVLASVVAEQMQSEKTIRDQERLMSSITDTSPALIYLYDMETQKNVYSNSGIEHILGYTSEEVRTMGSDMFFQLIHPDDLPRVIAFQSKITGAADAEILEIEYRMKHCNGKWFTLQSYERPFLRNAEGSVIQKIGIATDVSERKQAEESLQKSEDNLSITLHSIGDGVISTDRNGLIVRMNPLAEKLCGWNFADAAGKPLAEIFRIVNAETNETVADPVKRVLENGEIVGLANHTVLISADGTEYQIADSSAPIKTKEGEITGVVLVFSDITESYHAQKKIKESEIYLKETQIIAQLGTYTLDIATGIWSSSEILDGIFGIESNHDKSVQGWVSIIHPEWQKIMNDYFIEEVFGNKTKFNKEYQIVRKSDNEVRWVHGLGKLEYDNNLVPVRMLGTIQDISERKRKEQELAEAKLRAEESDRLKTAFLANMSHEIRTPMNGILGFAELLKEPNLKGDEQQEYIKIIEKSGVRMLNIINDIIDISKIESGLMKVVFNESNINSQIDYVYTFFKPEVVRKGMNLILGDCLPDEEVIVRTDREKLFAILTNLVKNAIKYSDKGYIEIGYNFKGNNLEFYVKDTGIGIHKDRHNAIFERFIQADISDINAREGAGLGLTITKAYVEMLGGTIWVESEIGEGSTFYFTIPYDIQNNEKREEIQTVPLEEKEEKDLRILIVDDDDISRTFLATISKKFCGKALFAKNGKEAVELCEMNHNLDLILMDIKMPVMNGYEATQQIRQFNSEVVIIAQTAFGLEGDREKSIEAGCNDYISKPVKSNDLQSLIMKHFNKKV